MKRNDLILFAILLTVGLVSLLVLTAVLDGKGEVAVVTVDGEEVLRLPLSEDTEVLIEGYGGGTNLVVIENGQASIREASCPDKVCVHTGHASALKSVVCAPNRVVLSIEEE